MPGYISTAESLAKLELEAWSLKVIAAAPGDSASRGLRLSGAKIKIIELCLEIVDSIMIRVPKQRIIWLHSNLERRHAGMQAPA
jgi:hypothetical protein